MDTFLRDTACRFMPASFDPAADLPPIPRPIDWQWESLKDALIEGGARVAMLRLPLFWQVLSPAHEACMAAGCSFFVNEKENSAVGEAAVRVGEVNFCITDSKDAAAFSLYLAEKNTRLNNWFIVHNMADEWRIPITLTGDDKQVFQEVHVTPGVPLLVQCKELSIKKEPRFHATSEFASVAPALTMTLAHLGACTCGKEILTKAA